MILPVEYVEEEEVIQTELPAPLLPPEPPAPTLIVLTELPAPELIVLAEPAFKIVEATD